MLPQLSKGKICRVRALILLILTSDIVPQYDAHPEVVVKNVEHTMSLYLGVGSMRPEGESSGSFNNLDLSYSDTFVQRIQNCTSRYRVSTCRSVIN